MVDPAPEKMKDIDTMIEKLVGDRFGRSSVNFLYIFKDEFDCRLKLAFRNKVRLHFLARINASGQAECRERARDGVSRASEGGKAAIDARDSRLRAMFKREVLTPKIEILNPQLSTLKPTP